jgi:hypothetical protein
MINSLKYIQTILSSTYNTLLSFISLVSSIFKGKENSSSDIPASPGVYDDYRPMSEGSNSFSSFKATLVYDADRPMSEGSNSFSSFKATLVYDADRPMSEKAAIAF